MTIPQFQCSKCRRLFDKRETSEEKRDKLHCPYCGEPNAEEILSKNTPNNSNLLCESNGKT